MADTDSETNLVTWVLETIKEDWPGEYPSTLRRIDRDEYINLDTGERTRSGELQSANFLAANMAENLEDPIGIDYNLSIESTVSVRLEGLHEDNRGHVANTAQFNRLVRSAKRALHLNRTDVPDGPDGRYYHMLEIDNETDMSVDHRDYFRSDWDVRFHGYEIFNDG